MKNEEKLLDLSQAILTALENLNKIFASNGVTHSPVTTMLNSKMFETSGGRYYISPQFISTHYQFIEEPKRVEAFKEVEEDPNLFTLWNGTGKRPEF